MIAHSLLLKRKSVQLHRSNLPLFGTGKQGGVVKHVAAGTLPSLQPFIKAKGHIPSISTVDTKYQHGIGIIYNLLIRDSTILARLDEARSFNAPITSFSVAVTNVLFS